MDVSLNQMLIISSTYLIPLRLSVIPGLVIVHVKPKATLFTFIFNVPGPNRIEGLVFCLGPRRSSAGQPVDVPLSI